MKYKQFLCIVLIATASTVTASSDDEWFAESLNQQASNLIRDARVKSQLTWFLYQYAQNGNHENLQKLLNDYPDLNVEVTDSHGKSPCDYAEQNGDAIAIEILNAYKCKK